MTDKGWREEHVVLLATGGTISSRASAPGAPAVAFDNGGQVLASVGVPAPYPVRVIDVLRKGSYLLTVEDMILVCAKIRQALEDPQVLGVVVSHGTDTMEETAYLADLVHDDPRPVVFTGAQQAADSEFPDGPDNLSRAIAVAGSPQARGHGVLVVFAGTIFPAEGVRKSHTTELDAFSNPDFGTAGTVSETHEIQMQLARSRPEALPLPAPEDTAPRVDLIASYPGADSTLLRASLQSGAAGIVLQGTGAGNANGDLCRWIADATATGIAVVTSTRVYAGPVVSRYGDGGGADLRAAGAVPSGLLRPSQSLILLNLLLRLHASQAQVAETFSRRGSPPDEAHQ